MRLIADEATWRAAIAASRGLDTGAIGIGLAGELPGPPADDADLCAGPPAVDPCALTFDSSVTGLPVSFALRPTEKGAGLVFADAGGDDAFWQDAVSIGRVGEFSQDGFEIEIVDGPGLSGIAFTIVDSATTAGESVDVYGPGDELLASFSAEDLPGDPGAQFLGFVSSRPIRRLAFTESDDADEIAIRDLRFSTAGLAELLTDGAAWIEAIGNRFELATGAGEVALADEVGATPGPDEQLCGSPAPDCMLSFSSGTTGLPWDLVLRPLEPGAGLTFGDQGGNTAWEEAISIGDLETFHQDSFEIEISGPPLYAFGFTLVGHVGETGELFSVLTDEDVLLTSIPATSIPDGNTFVGVISFAPIRRVAFSEGPGGDDNAVRDLVFGYPVYVSTTDDELDEDGDCSLREAFVTVESTRTDECTDTAPVDALARTVLLPPGLYPVTTTLTTELSGLDSLRILGFSAPATVLDGGDSHEILQLEGHALVVTDLTLQNGAPALDVLASTPTTLRRLRVLSNAARGLRTASQTVIEDTVFSGNSVNVAGAAQGGAVLALGAAPLTVRNSTFSGNQSIGSTSSEGGAIFALGGLELNNVTISGNQASGSFFNDRGGGLWASSMTQFSNSVISGNSATDTDHEDCRLFGSPPSDYNVVGFDGGCPSSATTEVVFNANLGSTAFNGGPTETRRPSGSSAAIDNGNPAAPGGGGMTCEAADQRALSRPGGIACDSGAYEVLSAALDLVKEDGTDAAVPGGTTTYTIEVSNVGDLDIEAEVVDVFPAELSCAWTCAPSAGASCIAGPSGGDLVDSAAFLPVGASLVYEAICAIDPGATGTLANTALATGEGAASDDSDDDLLTPEVDLGMAKTSESSVVGTKVRYEIVVGNQGPSLAAGARVVDELPATLESCAWTCGATGGGSCPSAGKAPLDEMVDLPPGSEATFLVSCVVATGVEDGTEIVNTATVAAAKGTTELDGSDNSDSAAVTVQVEIFTDRFESGDTAAWSTTIP